jgi:hypothetical protein
MSSAQYRIVSVTGPVGAGVSGSVWVHMNAVGKGNSPSVPYSVPNEFICSNIGRLLGLPIPPCGMAQHPDSKDPLFVSLDFNLTGSALPPVDPAECVTKCLDISTGLLLFDCWIGNSDRHRGNLSFDALGTPPQMSIFDHGHALLGYVQNAGVARLKQLVGRLAISGDPANTKGNRHCLLDALPDDRFFKSWIEKIGSVPDFQLEDVCREASSYGLSAPETAEILTFLKTRREKMREVIGAHRAEFKGIKQWSLFQ